MFVNGQEVYLFWINLINSEFILSFMILKKRSCESQGLNLGTYITEQKHIFRTLNAKFYIFCQFHSFEVWQNIILVLISWNWVIWFGHNKRPWANIFELHHIPQSAVAMSHASRVQLCHVNLLTSSSRTDVF